MTQQIANFQSKHPNQNYAFYWTKAQIEAIFANPDIDGIRVYIGQDENGKFQEYVNGCIGKDDAVQASNSSSSNGGGLPCPDWCSK